MYFGISTGFLRLDGKNLIEYLQMFRQIGFELIEIDANNSEAFPYHDPGFMSAFADEMHRTGVAVHSLHAPFHYSLADPLKENRQNAVGQILHLMENALPLTVEREKDPLFLVLHPGHHLSRTSARSQFRYCLESLNEILESPSSKRYHICLENMLSSHYCGKAPELIELVTALGGDRVSICLDTSHSVYDSNPVEFLDEVFPWLATTHISDNFHQSFGEFHAVPMSLLHSSIDWPLFFRRLDMKLEYAIFELTRPGYLDNDIVLEMAKLAAVQARRFLF